MTPERTAYFDSLFSLMCGIWFLLTGWIWTFGVNLVVAYPVGLIGLFFWNRSRRHDSKSRLNRAALIVLVLGFACSLAALLLSK